MDILSRIQGKLPKCVRSIEHKWRSILQIISIKENPLPSIGTQCSPGKETHS